MRINFEPCKLANIVEKNKIITSFEIVSTVCPTNFLAFDNFQITCIDSFSDYSRYLFDVYDVEFDRKYANNSSSYYYQDLIHNGVIRVFDMTLNFDLDFDFKLFNDQYIDLWKNNLDISMIKPLIISYTNSKLGYIAFNSIATSFFVKLVELVNTSNIMCKKIGNHIIFAYLVDNNNDLETYSCIECFVNAVYEIVKSTSGRFNYEIPEVTGSKIVNMKEWYDNRRKKQIKSKNIKFLD